MSVEENPSYQRNITLSDNESNKCYKELFFLMGNGKYFAISRGQLQAAEIKRNVGQFYDNVTAFLAVCKTLNPMENPS